jgi:hypothetical protein
LSGRKFTIITDHNLLVYLNSIKISSDRLTRWRLKLAEFDFNIFYKKGKANTNADAMSRINIGEKPERIMDELHALFSISLQKFDSISNTKFLTGISSIVFKDDTLNYSDQDILSSSPDVPIVVCIPSDLNLTGLTRSICEAYGLFPRHNRLNWKLGDCCVEIGTRTVLFLVTKRPSSDPPSLDHLESSLRKLVELCNEQQIQQSAFAKNERSLDKLNWTHVSELLNRCFTDSIKCTSFLNKKKPVEDSTEDLDINIKLKKLQRQDVDISKLIESVKKNKTKGYIIENDIIFKIRKGKNRRTFKQLVVPVALRADVLKLFHDNFTGSHLGESKTFIKLNNRFFWPSSFDSC